MNDAGNHIKSRVDAIAVLVRQIAQCKDAPYEIAQFAASAVFQLAQLEQHLNTLRDPAMLTTGKRIGTTSERQLCHMLRR